MSTFLVFKFYEKLTRVDIFSYGALRPITGEILAQNNFAGFRENTAVCISCGGLVVFVHRQSQRQGNGTGIPGGGWLFPVPGSAEGIFQAGQGE
ncbi:MAG: hypothetical protein OEZ59_13740 [Deltaproteobacteria bacterium]|nr:hypothetical protein [Deltaproteobacteria bacterium]